MKSLFSSLILSALCLLIFAPNINAQKIVVSEYYNESNSPSGEWTELLLTEDITSMVGYTLRDNSSLGVDWMGGVKFKDIDLWKNLRRGTIIVIHHRGWSSVGTDVKVEDGHIELGAINDTYFERFCEPIVSDCNWTDVDAQSPPLNLSQAQEIVQIRDASGNHIHALSNINDINGPSAAYNSMPSPKIIAFGPVNGGFAIRVFPGANLADYNRPFDKNNTYAMAGIATPKTIGMPNTNGASPTPTSNSNFWRQMREPNWSSPTLTATETSDSIKLTWTPSEADSKLHQAYMIVSYVTKNIGNSPMNIPFDGQIYNTGTLLGSGVVRGYTKGAVRSFSMDKKLFSCGTGYTFRVFAYKFDKDDQSKDNIEWNARGRAYNQTTYAEFKDFKLAGPPNPIITSVNNVTSICEGQVLDLTANYTGGTLEWYKWYLNDDATQVGDTRTIKVNKAGKYFVRVKIEGCEVESEDFVLNVVKYPNANIQVAGKTILNDTTIIICNGSDIALQGIGGDSGLWKLDENDFSTSNLISVNQVGTYTYTATNQNLCSNTSFKVKVELMNIDVSFNPSALDFGLVTFSEEKDVELTNNSNVDITIDKAMFTLPKDFLIANTDLPKVIKAGDKFILKVRYTPSGVGGIVGNIHLVQPCNSQFTFDVSGTKPSTNVTSDKGEIDFGRILNCEGNSKREIIKLKANGADPVFLHTPVISAPFQLIKPTTFPLKVGVGLEEDFEIEFNTGSDDVYNDILYVPYSADGINISDTLKIRLSGEFRIPTVSTISELNFETISACSPTKDTTIKFTNTSSIPIKAKNPKVDSRIEIISYPTNVIPSGEDFSYSIRYTPSLVDEGFSYPVEFEECNLTRFINFKSHTDGFVFQSTSDEIDFAEVIICAKSDKNFQINVSGSSADFAEIESIELSSDFSTTLKVGDKYKVGDVINFDVSLLDGIDESIDSELKIKFLPCGEKIIRLKAIRQNMMLDFSNKKIEFGEVSITGKGTDFVTITNNSKFDVELKDITGITAPFSYFFVGGGNLPKQIKSGQNLVITYEYVPDKADRFDTANVVLTFDKPCQVIENATLIANSPALGKRFAKVSLPSSIKAEPNELISVPIKVEKISSDLYAEAGIKKVKFTLNYHSTSLFPVSAITGADLDKSKIANLKMEENFAASSVDVSFDIIDASGMKDGIWIRVNFDVMLADVMETPLLINPNIFTSDIPIDVNLEQGKVNLEGVCNLNSRLIEISGSKLLYFTNGIILSGDEQELNFNSIVDDNIKIDLLNSYGQKISEVTNQFYKPGVYKQTLSLGNLSTGVYFISYHSQNILSTIKFIKLD